MTDIIITATTPPVITATLTTPDTISLSVSSPSTVSVTASVGNVGDMTKAVYDTDNDGIVDNSEALGGVAASGFVQTGNASWVDLTDDLPACGCACVVGSASDAVLSRVVVCVTMQ